MVQTPKRVKMLKQEIAINTFNGKEMANLKLYCK